MLRSLGHMLLGSMFIYGGANAFIKPEPRAALVEKAGIVSGSEEAKQAAIANGAIMVVAGAALSLDLAPKLASLILAGTLIPTTLVGHAFWKESDPTSSGAQKLQFMKNLAMLGGLLVVLSEKK